MALTGFPTPAARDIKSEECTEEYEASRNAEVRGKPLSWVASHLCGYPTPTVADTGAARAPRPKLNDHPRDMSQAGSYRADLKDMPYLVGWASPQTHDAQGGKTPEQIAAMRERTQAGVANLNEQCFLTVPGPTSASSPAPTARRGVLDAAFSAWLMGFHQDPTIPGWNTYSPGWSEWGTVSRLLAEYYEVPAQTA